MDPENQCAILGRPQRHHLLISGTGRAGTSLLVQILHACGLDTTLGRDRPISWDNTAFAGHETIPLLPGDHPYVVKSPWSYQFIEQLVEEPSIHLDGVILPVRRLAEATSSRIILELQRMYQALPWLLELEDEWSYLASIPGGVTYSLEPLDQARVLAHGFHRLIECLVEREIPIHLISFPRFCADLDYLHRAIRPVLPAPLDQHRFKELVSPVIHLERVRATGEVNDALRTNPVSTERTDVPRLADLHKAALKREVRRLSDEVTALQSELRVLRQQNGATQTPAV